MNKFFNIIVVLFCFVASMSLEAQYKSWEFGVSGGLTNYQGDVVPTHFFQFRENSPAFGAHCKKYLWPNVGVRASYLRGKIKGNDANFDIRSERLGFFTTDLNEFSLRFDFEVLDEFKYGFFRTGGTPYAFFGGAYGLQKVTTNYGLYNSLDAAMPWIASDIKGQSDAANYLSLVLGFGMKFQTKSGVNFSIETGYRPTNTDFLDGMSATGNPNNKDSYLYTNFAIGYRFGKGEDTDGDGIPDDNDLCPDVAGVVDLFGCPDRDGDGVADEEDLCPDVPGVVAGYGCPDSDGDGTYDYEDYCPDIVGPYELYGCPDTDGDGVVDIDDYCPELPGTKEMGGCPDTDGDGVPDDIDKCPDLVGPKDLDGCPESALDKDGDGVFDTEDDCPEVPGLARFYGCPDTDGDNVPDSEDDCPDVAGDPQLKGCLDSDKDGVPDHIDECKDLFGPADNNGCPVVPKIPAEISDYGMKVIYFKTGNAKLDKDAIRILEQTANLMKKYPEYNLDIGGYTDNTGSSKINLKLSKDRVASCKKYLVSKGIDGSRITAEGFGILNPVADNSTDAGRKLNRRVELKFIGI